MLDMNKIGMSPDKYELTIKANVINYRDNDYKTKQLLNLINTLQNIQFEVIKATIKMQSIQSNSYQSTTYPIQQLLQNKQIEIDKSIYNDAIFQVIIQLLLYLFIIQYITAASSIRNSSLSSFNSTSDVESTIKNLYFVVQNGLGPLRFGSEAIAKIFYDFYYSRLSYWTNTFQLIMILGIIFVFCAQLILIPIIFSVHKTNNKVLSLFGYIPPFEIKELVGKCEIFIVNFLEAKNEKLEISMEKSKICFFLLIFILIKN